MEAIVTGRILELVNNQILQARNSWIGVETMTFYTLEYFDWLDSTVAHDKDWF